MRSTHIGYESLERCSSNRPINLEEVNDEKTIKEFFGRVKQESILDKPEVNTLLVHKCMDIMGKIDDIINLFSDSLYHSSINGTYNSNYYGSGWTNTI